MFATSNLSKLTKLAKLAKSRPNPLNNSRFLQFNKRDTLSNRKLDSILQNMECTINSSIDSFWNGCEDKLDIKKQFIGFSKEYSFIKGDNSYNKYNLYKSYYELQIRTCLCALISLAQGGSGIDDKDRNIYYGLIKTTLEIIRNNLVYRYESSDNSHGFSFDVIYDDLKNKLYQGASHIDVYDYFANKYATNSVIHNVLLECFICDLLKEKCTRAISDNTQMDDLNGLVNFIKYRSEFPFGYMEFDL